MSEHRRKPPQPQGGGRAAARRGAQQPPSGRRAAPQRGATGSAAGPAGDQRPYGGRAEARRAAQRTGGGRRRAAVGHDGGGRGRAAAREPQQKRLIDYPRSDRYGPRRWVPSWKQVIGSCIGFFGLIVLAAGVALAWVDVPNLNDAAKTQKNVYYWSNDKRMAVAGGGDLNRQIVPIAKIPKSMQSAVISAENATFYEDSGVDPVGIARAVVNMAMGGSTQSGSTITQQYVKNAMLSQDQTVKRKLSELFISIKVGATKDKNEILEGYLNTAYYGRGAYGIQAAAQAYYDKDCEDLNASESAFLSAVLNGPNLYDPVGGEGPTATAALNTDRAQKRWEWTLNREVEVGRMSATERDKWVKQRFPMPEKPKPATDRAGQKGYLINLADNFVVANSKITKAQLDKGGYEIHTTFDQKKVGQLEAAVKKVTKENLDPKQRKVDNHVQFGGASVEPHTGKIVAIYGGKDATEHFTNNADYTGVQVGSTFKPFVLAAAMTDGKRDPKGERQQGPDERKLVSPASIYDGDNKLTLKDYDGSVWLDEHNREWHQKNDGNEDRGPIDLRKAMQFSVNTPYIQLGMDVGTDKVKEAAIRSGLNEDQLASITPSFSLGTSAPSAIRLAGAYSTFAASGKQVDPYSVEYVENKNGEAFRYKAKQKPGITENVANNVTDVLKNVVEKGTGTSARLPGRPVAGKTGTTDGNKSAWFAGYTRQLSTAIGMFRVNDQAKSQKFLEMYGVGGEKSIHGASYPAEIWGDYMGKAMQGKRVMPFPKPEPIGEKIFGNGASPSPTPTPSVTPSETPSESPSESPSSTPSTSPSPTDSCSVFDPQCQTSGGTSDGADAGADGGTDSGSSGSPSPPGNGNGNPDGGGIFGGPTGTRRD
ncbi:transglycosylase domain-containing protein [Streptomyces sp. NPDC004647]|uniref:transglycosylase domain-containing protein n=1 Tax=Streptomyces sp. NPDC004647 TaxID=3154671 RepID=UPI0033B9BB7B